MGLISHDSPLVYIQDEDEREARMILEPCRLNWLARLAAWWRPAKPIGPVPDAPFTFKPKKTRQRRIDPMMDAALYSLGIRSETHRGIYVEDPSRQGGILLPKGLDIEVRRT